MFDQALESIFQDTFEIAELSGHPHVSPEHLLVQQLDNSDIVQLLDIFVVDKANLSLQINTLIDNLPRQDLANDIKPEPTSDLIALVEQVKTQAIKVGKKEIAPTDVIVEMIKTKACIAGELLRTQGLTYNSSLLRYISFGITPIIKAKHNFGLLILNDNYTSFDHVIRVLMKKFMLEHEQALAITKKIHHEGKAFLGYFDKETAYFIVRRINQ